MNLLFHIQQINLSITNLLIASKYINNKLWAKSKMRNERNNSKDQHSKTSNKMQWNVFGFIYLEVKNGGDEFMGYHNFIILYGKIHYVE